MDFIADGGRRRRPANSCDEVARLLALIRALVLERDASRQHEIESLKTRLADAVRRDPVGAWTRHGPLSGAAVADGALRIDRPKDGGGYGTHKFRASPRV